MSSPGTIDHAVPSVVHGNPEISPSCTPYEPSDGTAIDTQLPFGVPCAQSRTWSTAALAADAALEEPRASMIAAPRCCTVGMNSFSIQLWSPMASAAAAP